MSGLEPGTVYRALREVQEGADPADVYQQLMGESINPEEAIEMEILDANEADHDFEECRDKFGRGSFCHGTSCVHIQGGIRLQVDCPCTCHQGEEP